MGRFKRFIRRGVYACTLLVLVMFAGSFKKNRSVVSNALYLYNGRALVMVYVSPRPKSERDVPDSEIHDLFTLMMLDLEPRDFWTWPEVRLSAGSERFRVDVPLIYPLLAGLAISTRLFVVSRRMRLGPSDCKLCGYPLVGLEADTCPECGAGCG